MRYEEINSFHFLRQIERYESERAKYSGKNKDYFAAYFASYLSCFILYNHISHCVAAPTIMRPRVQIPSKLATLFSIYTVEIETVFVIGMRKGRE